jgi:hypothetical protein
MTYPKTFGYLAEFEDVESFLSAARQVRDAGYTHWDAHTPFVVHGLDEAMGIRKTILPWLVFGAGATGCAVGLGLQYWTNAVDYPFLISGKPFFSLPANIPVVFELTILFAAITAMFGMLILNGLPKLYHPVLKSKRFRRSTTDRFFISIEADDPRFDPAATRELIESLSPAAIEELED